MIKKKKYITEHNVELYITTDGEIYSARDKLLKHNIDKAGYHSVLIYSKYDKKRHRYLVHRLVADAFIGNVKNYQVHHLDGDKGNNRVDNLEIIDVKDHNRLHKQIYPLVRICVICGKPFEPYESKRSCAKVCSEKCKIKLDKINASKRKRPIIQMDLDGNYIKRWLSARDVQNELGYFESNINKCCNNIINTYKGYKWRYDDE